MVVVRVAVAAAGPESVSKRRSQQTDELPAATGTNAQEQPPQGPHSMPPQAPPTPLPGRRCHSLVHEQRGGLDVAVPGGVVQRRVLVAVQRVHVGARLQQHLRAGGQQGQGLAWCGVAEGHGAVEYYGSASLPQRTLTSPPLLSPNPLPPTHTPTPTPLHTHLHALDLVVARGKVQRGAPLLVLLVHVHALLPHQRPQPRHVACSSKRAAQGRQGGSSGGCTADISTPPTVHHKLCVHSLVIVHRVGKGNV